MCSIYGRKLGPTRGRLPLAIGSSTLEVTLNLIIFCPNNERKAYIHDLAHKVLERLPCNILWIEERPDVPVSTHTAPLRIEIYAPPTEFDKIPLLILPYFLPDLPIYLLWAHDPSQYRSLLVKLQALASRHIYDSEVSPDLTVFAQTLIEDYNHNGKELGDLNWARTESWRDLITATLRARGLTERVFSLQICYNHTQTPLFCHTQMQALYLQAWLQSVLPSCKITHVPETNPFLPPGTIIALHIKVNDGSYVEIRRNSSHPYQVHIITCDEEKCALPSRFIFSKEQAGLSLVNQIYPTTSSPTLLQTLYPLARHAL